MDGGVVEHTNRGTRGGSDLRSKLLIPLLPRPPPRLRAHCPFWCMGLSIARPLMLSASPITSSDRQLLQNPRAWVSNMGFASLSSKFSDPNPPMDSPRL